MLPQHDSPCAHSDLVVQLLKLFKTPVPRWIFSLDPAIFCETARALHQTRVNLAERVSRPIDDSIDAPTNDLSIQTYAAILEQCTAMQVTARVVLPEVINMLTLILRLVYPHHMFCASVAYAIAKAPQLEFAPALRLHREAALLMCRRYEEKNGDSSAARCDPSCDASRSQCGSGSSDLSDEYQTSTGGAEDYLSYDVGEDDEDEYGAPPCVGHDRKLLCPGDTETNGPAVACVDDEEGIVPVLTSALYHRWNLGLRGALIGLVCDRTSTVIRTVLGWLDEKIEEGNDLPRTHFTAFADACSYDLKDPVEAVSLLLFLRKSRLVSVTDAPTVPLAMLSWRADLHSRVEDSSHQLRLYDEEGIRRWSSAIYRDDECSTTIRRTTEPMSKPSSASGNDRLLPTVTRLTKAEAKSQGSDDRSKAGSKKNESASTYVVRQHRGLPRCQPYFYARKAILYSTAAGANKTTPIPAAYVNAASLVQLSGNLHQLQHHCPSHHNDRIIISLREQYLHCRNNNKFIGYMTPEVEAVIKNSFCMIMHVVEEAQALAEVRPLRPEVGSCPPSSSTTLTRVYNEVNFRHQWDQLVTILVQRCASTDRVQYEREVSLSYPEHPLRHNPHYDLSNISDVFNTVYPYPTYRQPDAHKAFQYWTLASGHLANDRARAHEEIDEEPMRGIADGIITLTIPSAFSSGDIAKAVSIWVPTTAQENPDASDQASVEDCEAGLRFGSSLLGIKAKSSARPSYSQQQQEAFAEAMRVDCAFVRSGSLGPMSESKSEPEHKSAVNGIVQSLENMEIESQEKLNVASLQHLPCGPCDLHIPLLAAGYKSYKGDTLGNMAMDQGRLHQVAITTFLRLFNIARFPIFGLVTKGSSGVMTCSWADNVRTNSINTDSDRGSTSAESEHEVIWMSDQDAIVVDLTNPLDALNVATFIAYIVCHHAPVLRKLFQAADRFDAAALKQYLSRPEEPDPLPLQKARQMKLGDDAWKKQRVPVPEVVKDATPAAARTKDSIGADPTRTNEDGASGSVGAEATGTGAAQAESSDLTRGGRATRSKKKAEVIVEEVDPDGSGTEAQAESNKQTNHGV
ncbi:hypothetical protein C8Q80DRAFT_593747 [Daedaleopsis nitida]|nr:hypothetical protein C8Q80DRAFT_593747 [Daedaleopsis nitida]